MRLKLFIIIIVCCFGHLIFAQNQLMWIDGRIYVSSETEESPQLDGILVQNLTQNKKDVTDATGKFQLQMAENDSIKVSSSFTKTRYLQISNRIIETQQIRIFLKEQIIELDEALIGQFNFSGYLEQDLKKLPEYKDTLGELYNKLGLNQKRRDYEFIPDTTKLQAADAIRLIQDLGRLSKLISGDIRRDRNWVRYAKRQEKVKQVQNYFPKKYFTQDLQIPENKIQEFLTFASYSIEFGDLLKKAEFMSIQIQLEQQAKIFNQRREIDKQE